MCLPHRAVCLAIHKKNVTPNLVCLHFPQSQDSSNSISLDYELIVGAGDKMTGETNPPRKNSLKDLPQTAGSHQGIGAKGQRAPHWQVQAKTMLSPVVYSYIKGLKQKLQRASSLREGLLGSYLQTADSPHFLPTPRCSRGHCGLEN